MQTGVRITKAGMVIGIVTVLILLFIYIKGRASSDRAYYSCTQLEAAGHHDIKSTDPLYNIKFDRDRDQVACEL